MWIPLTIFFLGVFLSWRKSQLDKKKEVHVYRELFIDWITLAKDRTLKQVKNCDNFAHSLLNSEYIDTARFLAAPLMYGKLNTVNTDKVISSFVFNITGAQKENLENFNKMLANINYLDKIELELKEKHEKASTDLFQVNESFNELFQQLERTYLNKLSEIGNQSVHSDFDLVKFISKTMAEWEQTAMNSENGISANHTFEKLIFPLREKVNAEFQKNTSNQFLLSLLNTLTGLIIIKRKWQIYKIGHSKNFEEYGKAISSSYSNLEECVK